MKNLLLKFLGVILIFVFAAGCKPEKDVNPSGDGDDLSEFLHPSWAYNANIYEVNIRQYTPEGTFRAFETHLPRLKTLGVDILWLMPIHPIGVEGRKGSLGSYYSIKDYKGVNPEFGTLEDFKHLVNTAHNMGMKVILDWVANHTAWDHPWITQHPDWYTKNANGEIIPPVPDWTDVADLNYDAQGLRDAMKDAMEYWVTETDIDGYRCDVAAEVPLDFWESVTPDLKGMKEIFMLAEAEGADLHNKAFDMTYGWEFHHILNEIAQGRQNVNDFWAYYDRVNLEYDDSDYRMMFITNHDENSWNGTVWERMGDAAYPLAVVTFGVPGMPLCYSGQEAGLNKRLKFFDKDTINWQPHPMNDLYTRYFALRHNNSAIWSGERGGEMHKIQADSAGKVLSFIRKNGPDEFWLVVNLSRVQATVNLTSDQLAGIYKNVESGENLVYEEGMEMVLPAWSYRVFVKE